MLAHGMEASRRRGNNLVIRLRKNISGFLLSRECAGNSAKLEIPQRIKHDAWKPSRNTTQRTNTNTQIGSSREEIDRASRHLQPWPWRSTSVRRGVEGGADYYEELLFEPYEGRRFPR